MRPPPQLAYGWSKAVSCALPACQLLYTRDATTTNPPANGPRERNQASRDDRGLTLKHTCRNCLFLAQRLPAVPNGVGAASFPTFTWSADDRKRGDCGIHAAVECAEGTWSQVGGELGAEVLDRDRRGECPFVEWKGNETMSFPGARKLYEQRLTKGKAKRDALHLCVSIVGAVAALVAAGAALVAL